MAGFRLGIPKIMDWDNNGAPAVGWKIWTYRPGTTTPKATYSNSTLSAFNTNPVVLNARGEADVYLPSATKIVLTTPTGDPASPVWSVDNVGPENPTNIITAADYGAVGDGITNDAAAIQAAIDSGIKEIYLSNIGSNIYNLGTTSLTITTPIHFHMATGTSIIYTGADAPIVVDCHAAVIDGLVLELYDVFSGASPIAAASGNYVVKFMGDGIAAYSTATVARSKISAHRLGVFKLAAVFVKWCLFAENEINILNIYPDQATYPNAWGFYFDPTDVITGNYASESNLITVKTNNSRRALYGSTALFDINQINIGTDYGGLTFDATQENMVIGGASNIITIPFVIVPSAQQPRTTKVHLLSAATRNILNIPATYLSGVVDDSPVGANAYPSNPEGGVNFLKNSSFESWNSASATPFWDLNCNLAPSTTYVRHGNKSAAVTSNAAFTNMSQVLPTVLVGQTIAMNGWFMSPGTNTDTAQFGLNCSAGSNLLNIANDGYWHFLSISYAVPGGATGLRAYIFAGSGAANQTIYADGLTVTVGTAPTMDTTDPTKVLFGTATWDLSATTINNGSNVNTTVGCIGAEVGDPVSVGFSIAVPAGSLLSASVTAADTVTVTWFNNSGGNIVNPGSGTLTVAVRK